MAGNWILTIRDFDFLRYKELDDQILKIIRAQVRDIENPRLLNQRLSKISKSLVRLAKNLLMLFKTLKKKNVKTPLTSKCRKSFNRLNLVLVVYFFLLFYKLWESSKVLKWRRTLTIEVFPILCDMAQFPVQILQSHQL